VKPAGKLAAALAIAAVGVVAAGGCVSQREAAQEQMRPRNRVFIPSELLPRIALREGEGGALNLFERGEAQSVHVLQLAPEMRLQERYHYQHDLTLVCVQGNAIVEVEGVREFVQPGSAVFVPRLYSYEVLPHRTEKTFVALLIYSPPYEGKDLVLMEK